MCPAVKDLDQVIDALLEDACMGARQAPRPGVVSGTAAKVARHACAVREAGGSDIDVLDSALVAMLFDGESRALAEIPGGDPDNDPAGVRAVAARLLSYPESIRRRTGKGHPMLVNGHRNLQLMTTRRCQLRCSYCPVVKRESDMPLEIMESAVDLLVGSSKDDVRLDFTGGEPLLRKDDVLRTADRLIDRASAAGKRASFYMVTNGFLMTRRVAEDLAARGFRVELSLDGPEETHNRHKLVGPGAAGLNPYRATVDAIRSSLEAGLPCTVVMVVSPDTVDLLEPGFEHAIGLGVPSIDVNYAVGRRWAGSASVSFTKALAQVIGNHAADLRSGRLSIGNISSKVEPAILNAEWMVDTDGSLHLMTEWALESSRDPGAPVTSAGNVRGPIRWDDLFAGRFHAYHALLGCYAWRSARLRALVHDNVKMGRFVSERMGEARR